MSIKETILDPLIKKNPITIQILGVCSALAVTTQMKNAVIMGLAVSLCTGLSCFFVSLVRNYIPSNARIILQLVIIASIVIVIDQFLRAYLFELSKALSLYVGLIITNCILLGRTEAFAMQNPPGISFVDGFFTGIGYMFVLLSIAFVRELFGSGKIFGYPLFSLTRDGGWYEPNGLLLLAPSAFFLIGVCIWILRSLDSSQLEE